MTSLEDKAESGDDFEVILASESAGVYRLRDTELTSSENIRDPDSFPEYGDFIEAVKVRAVDNEWTEAEAVWLECPASLAADLVELSVEPGDVFALSEPSKGPGGSWRFTVQPASNVSDLL